MPDTEFTITCPYCGEEVEIYVEPETRGVLVQDCEVCCNPWQLRVRHRRRRALCGRQPRRRIGVAASRHDAQPRILLSRADRRRCRRTPGARSPRRRLHAFASARRGTRDCKPARSSSTGDSRTATRPCAPAQHLVWQRRPWHEPEVPLAFDVLYEDDAVLAVSKPSGLPTMPAGGFLEHTLLRAGPRPRRRRASAASTRPLHVGDRAVRAHATTRRLRCRGRGARMR